MLIPLNLYFCLSYLEYEISLKRPVEATMVLHS